MNLLILFQKTKVSQSVERFRYRAWNILRGDLWDWSVTERGMSEIYVLYGQVGRNTQVCKPSRPDREDKEGLTRRKVTARPEYDCLRRSLAQISAP